MKRSPAAEIGTEKPVLSIIVPCFNGLPYVRTAIESAQNQTLELIEIVIVDDGSDAKTQESLQGYQDDPRVKLVRQENSGPSSARNTGIAVSTGKYVGFLDADDLWYPTKAAVHVSYMDEHEDVDATFSWWEIIDADGRSTGRRSRYSKTQVFYEDLLIENVTGTASTLVVKRTAIGRAGTFREDLTSNVDLEWLLRIAEIGTGNIHCICEILTSYRRHGHQITDDWRRMQDGWELVCDIAEERQPERVHPIEVRARANQQVYWSYLAYESEQYPTSRRLLLSAWRSSPRLLVAMPRAWRMTAAAMASTLPQRLHSLLRRLAERVSGRRFG